MIFDPPTTSRRRTLLRVLIPAALVIAAILAVIASAAGEETRAELDYLSQLRAQASELSKDGDALREVVSRLQRIDRLEFETAIDGIREDLGTGLEFIDENPPTERLLPVRALYREALELWDSGIVGYASAVLTAADEPENAAVVDIMANGLAELRAGDGLYSDLMAEYQGFEGDSEPISALPPVVLSPADGAIVSLAAAYIDSARSPNNGLALRPGLSVAQIVADPEWEVDPSNQAVVPATASVTFSVVVANTGNVVSQPETLILTLVGGPDQVRQEHQLEALPPGSRRTIGFEPFAVEPGTVYQVTATVVVTGVDTDLTDNELAVQFTVNQG